MPVMRLNPQVLHVHTTQPSASSGSACPGHSSGPSGHGTASVTISSVTGKPLFRAQSLPGKAGRRLHQPGPSCRAPASPCPGPGEFGSRSHETASRSAPRSRAPGCLNWAHDQQPKPPRTPRSEVPSRAGQQACTRLSPLIRQTAPPSGVRPGKRGCRAIRPGRPGTLRGQAAVRPRPSRCPRSTQERCWSR